jgi:hypothetical protein
MSDFQSASAIHRVSDTRFRAQIPEGWEQGRGAFGGLVLGVLARCMIAVESDTARRLRTITGDICGPVLAGEIEIDVETLRRGANLSNFDARLQQGGKVLARASAALGSARSASAKPHAPQPPETWPTPWTTFEPLPIEPPLGPVFAQHYEYRSAGPLPFSGGTQARLDAFIREKNCSQALDAPALIALLDSAWPTLYSVEALPRALATISFTAELFRDPGNYSADEPLRFRSQLAALEDGFMTEFRELWHGETLLALNQQTMALIR